MRSPYAHACIIAALCAAVFGVGSYRAIAAGGTITGHAYVVDGDTVVVSGIHVRLKGVDAAERGTVLGEHARRVMIAIVGNSALTCRLTGEKTWNREVGFCFTDRGVDINRAIVESGAALSCPRYDTRYVQFEQASAIEAQQRAKYCVRRRRKTSNE